MIRTETQAAREVPAGRPEAAAAVWNWRAAEASRSGGSRGRPRLRALVQALVAAAVGGVVALGEPVFARVIWSAAALLLAVGLASPHRVYAAIERGLARFGHHVGRLLTVVLLVPLFYTFFLGFGGLARRGRRDRLTRWFDRDAASYWRRRGDGERGPAHFERMY
jgi:hypothetical protein